MGKSLTLKEVMDMEVGDWVYLKRGDKELYARVVGKKNDAFVCNHNSDWTPLPYASYGDTWVAYKNKEQAETTGEVIDFPVMVGDTVYFPDVGKFNYGRVENIHINLLPNGRKEIMYEWASYDDGPEIIECWDEGSFSSDDIGKEVFLTRAARDEYLLNEGISEEQIYGGPFYGIDEG